MPPEQSLEELKAENLNEDAIETDVADDLPDDEADNDADIADDDTAGDSDTAGDDDADASDSSEVNDDWMKADDDDDEPAKKFGDSDMAGLRRKMKGKLQAKDTELEEANAKIAQLESGQGAQTDKLVHPDRDKFDSDETYSEAMVKYQMDKRDADNLASYNYQERQKRNLAKANEIKGDVEAHYDRAVVLAKESGITAEQYSASDDRVRRMIRGVFPKRGETVIEQLISDLGEGSEKAFYNLGVNNTRLAELKTILETDGSGIRGAMYIAKLSERLNTPRRRTTNAPAPAPDIKGDVQPKAGEKALKKAYQSADKRGDTQARFDARRTASKAGIDVSNW